MREILKMLYRVGLVVDGKKEEEKIQEEEQVKQVQVKQVQVKQVQESLDEDSVDVNSLEMMELVEDRSVEENIEILMEEWSQQINSKKRRSICQKLVSFFTIPSFYSFCKKSIIYEEIRL
jgi:hypothetical protein